MREVLSVRLDEHWLERLRLISRDKSADLSSIARDLMEHGWVYMKIRDYRQGKLSFASFAKETNLSLIEAIRFLGELGVRSPLDYDLYLRGYKVAAELGFQARR
jgi:hypothetical protein